jgi:hypothetical protein
MSVEAFWVSSVDTFEEKSVCGPQANVKGSFSVEDRKAGVAMEWM